MTLLLIFALYAVTLSFALARAGNRSRIVASRAATPVRPERILIIGATGGTGRELVAQALQRGYAVTAFVRDPSRLMISHPQLRIVQGDVLDSAAVTAAMAGHDAVVSALGHKRYFYPTRILSQGTRNLVMAMVGHGVRRLVCETALGLGDSAGRLGLYYTLFIIPIILPFYFWDKARQERIIARSNIDWVIVRPGALTNASKRGRYHSGRHLGNFLWTVRISRAEVAEFMLNQLESDTFLRTAASVAW